MDYEDNLEGVEDEIDDVIDDGRQQQQQQQRQPPPQPRAPRRQPKSSKSFSNNRNNDDQVMNLVQGIVENQEKERMKQRAQRLYKQLISGRGPIRRDYDDYDNYDDDYDDDDDDGYRSEAAVRGEPRRTPYYNDNYQQENNGDRFLELFDDLSNTITEDSKKYRVDAINKEFGLDNLFNDTNQQQQQQQDIDDDASSKTSDEGENNGSYGERYQKK